MKLNSKLFAGALLAMSSFSAFAQIDDIVNKPIDYSKGSSRPTSFNPLKTAQKSFEFLFSRIHTLDIQGQTMEMEKDGVKERKFIAAFSASGAAVYNHELIKGEDLGSTGRDVGLQLVPYTIKYDQTGSYYLAVNPISLKNMLTLENSKDSWHAGLFKVLDTVDFLVVKWDKGMSFEGIDSFGITFINAEAKLDILNSPKPSRFLALTGGVSAGMSQSTIQLENGTSIMIGGKDLENFETNAGYAKDYAFKYGLEYKDKFQKGSEIKVGLQVSHSVSSGQFLDKDRYTAEFSEYTDNKAMWDAHKAEVTVWGNELLNWLNKNRNGYSYTPAYPQNDVRRYLGNDSNHMKSFSEATGMTTPVVPSVAEIKAPKPVRESIMRNQIYLSPSIEFAMPLGKANKNMIGIGGTANIPLRDTLKGGTVNSNLSGNNRNLINAKIFVRF